MTRREKRPACPRCGSRAIPIIYGLMTVADAKRLAKRGPFAEGGCCCWGDDRDHPWACPRCGCRWGGRGQPPHLPEWREADRGVE